MGMIKKTDNPFYKVSDGEAVEQPKNDPSADGAPIPIIGNVEQKRVCKKLPKFEPKVKVGVIDKDTPDHLLVHEKAAQKRAEEEGKKPKSKGKGKKKNT